jgi:adenine deaminase
VTTDLAVADGVVAGWGWREAEEEIDLDGAAVTAGLVDAHMHLESTKLWIDEFVRTVLPLGTTAVAADPHEVANVFGIPGVAALIAAARQLPFTFGVCASSCVPASPFESPGAELFAPDVATLLEDFGAIGVAEVMNFPGVVAGDPEMLARIATAGRRRVDGHAPGTLRRAARCLPGRRGGVRPRVHRARRGRGEAAQGDVGLHPAGVGQPEPA